MAADPARHRHFGTHDGSFVRDTCTDNARVNSAFQLVWVSSSVGLWQMVRWVRGQERRKLTEVKLKWTTHELYVWLWLFCVFIYIGHWMYWEGSLALSRQFHCPSSL